jgi:hypothetical protein
MTSVAKWKSVAASTVFRMLYKMKIKGIARFNFTKFFSIRQAGKILVAFGGFFNDVWTYLDIHFATPT